VEPDADADRREVASELRGHLLKCPVFGDHLGQTLRRHVVAGLGCPDAVADDPAPNRPARTSKLLGDHRRRDTLGDQPGEAPRIDADPGTKRTHRQVVGSEMTKDSTGIESHLLTDLRGAEAPPLGVGEIVGGEDVSGS
jgi:hypothetical protein